MNGRGNHIYIAIIHTYSKNKEAMHVILYGSQSTTYVLRKFKM
jgi:hypothetical protein